MPSPTCFSELQLPAEAVAQLGHTDGGALVRKLYGHPDADLQRRRIREATRRARPAERRRARAEPPDDES